MVSAGNRQTTRLRSVFVSDVHLGSKGCRADALLEFLKSIEVDYLFLVGDIVDLWAMRKNFYWPQEHNNVLRTVLGKAKGGTRVIYIPGNHDEELREFCGTVFGNLEIHREFVHRTADGRQLLEKLWPVSVRVEERTVDVHIRRLRSSLERLGCAEYVQTVRGSGYRFSALPQ